MKDWAVILGASSGFGAAACRELATHGVNIYGIHLDRKTTMDSVISLVNDLKGENVEVQSNYEKENNPIPWHLGSASDCNSLCCRPH